MSDYYAYMCIIVMAVITYIIRVLPLVIFRNKIKNLFFRSVLTYAPYVTLSVLTFPSIFYCTGNFYTALGGCIVALLCSVFNRKLLFTVMTSCLTVYLLQLIF